MTVFWDVVVEGLTDTIVSANLLHQSSGFFSLLPWSWWKHVLSKG